MFGTGKLYRRLGNFIDSPAVILLYHRVTNLLRDPQLLAVSPDNFNDQIKHLRSNYNLITISELQDLILNKRKIPRKTVAITFDDGYADNLVEALPILETHEAQALFFITTSKIGTKEELWWDTLERIFLLDNPLPNNLTLTTSKNSYNFNTSSLSQRERTYHEIHPVIKDCRTGERDLLIANMLDWASLSKEGRETHRMLKTQELLKLSISKAAVIGAHTYSHPKLSLCSFEEQFAEIQMSKSNLESITGKTIEYFSYPFGTLADYNRDSMKACEKIGFAMVCANYYNQVHRWHNRFELPRVLVRNWPLEEFNGYMASFFRY